MQTTADILAALSAYSARPRFAYMLLGLMSEVADNKGSIGPRVGSQSATVREWLASSLIPMCAHHRRRQSLLQRMRKEMAAELPLDPEAANALLEEKLKERAARSVKTNISRAMTELERAGLVKRHYAGYRTNHHNRGGGRHAVYTVTPEALAALRRRAQLI